MNADIFDTPDPKKSPKRYNITSPKSPKVRS